MSKINPKILQALAVTAEVCGSEISTAAAQVIATELSLYPEPAVLLALKRVMNEHQGRLTLAAIKSRIDDGRPTAEAAWAALPHCESQTAILTQEQQSAWAVAAPLLEARDKVGARMAFTAEYNRLCATARAQGAPVQWNVSLGYDAGSRAAALAEAVRRNQIPADYAITFAPEHARAILESAGITDHPMLAGSSGPKRDVLALVAGVLK